MTGEELRDAIYRVGDAEACQAALGVSELDEAIQDYIAAVEIPDDVLHALDDMESVTRLRTQRAMIAALYWRAGELAEAYSRKPTSAQRRACEEVRWVAEDAEAAL